MDYLFINMIVKDGKLFKNIQTYNQVRRINRCFTMAFYFSVQA